MISGGKILEIKAAGTAPGTGIEVRQLFFNLPGRRKSLRSEAIDPRRFVLQILDELKASGPQVNSQRLGEHMVAKTVLAIGYCRLAIPVLSANM